jgi:hypothetical protein
MSGSDTNGEQENPICLVDRGLPPPPDIGGMGDPADPHPAEPGAPLDAPEVRPLRQTAGSSS